MEPSKKQILEVQIQAVMKLTGRSRQEALKIIQDQQPYSTEEHNKKMRDALCKVFCN